MERTFNKMISVLIGGGLTLFMIFGFIGHAKAVTLKRGDILIADVDGGAIIRVDPTTGTQTVISSGVNLVSPTGLMMDRAGDILVADSGANAVIRVNPATGGQTVISSGGFFSFPIDLTIDATGQILVVDSNAFGPDVISGGTGGVIRVDPLTGAQTAVSSGGNFHGPTGIALDAAGYILVADVDFGGSPGVSGPGAIIRVDPSTGAQTVISSGGSFVGPVRVAVAPTGQIFVSDHGSFRTGTTIGAIFRIDPATGAQTVIYNSSGGGPIQGPEGLTLDAAGNILVAFKGHPNFDVPDGIAQINPVTGTVTVVSSGGSLVGPLGIAVVALVPGDILIADPDAHAVIRVDPMTGAQSVLSSGGSFIEPLGLTVDPRGQVLVVDAGFFGIGKIIRVDPLSGAQSVVSSGGLFVHPFDITVDAAGQILVVDTEAFGGPGGIIRVDPLSGAQTPVSSGGNFLGPTGITLDATGQIIVGDVDAFGGSGGIIRIDPISGTQTVISSGGSFVGPVRTVIDSTGQIFVSDQSAFRNDGNNTLGAIFRVDPVSGAQTVIYNSSGGGPVQGSEGIALDATGQILVAFRGHPNIDRPDGVARIDPVTGAVTVISSDGILVGPFGIAVVPKALNSAIAVTKTATAAVHVGDPINVTAHVTNTGDTTLTMTVVDDKAGTLAGLATLAPGASADYTGSYVAPGAGSTSTNTVTASGVDPLGQVVTATASFTTTILNDPPAVGTLSSSPAAVGDSVLIATGTSVAFSAPWTDVNLQDTHTAVCNVVDVFGATPTTTVAGSAPGSGGGTATCVVTFTTTGIFNVTMTVTDQDGASGTSTALQVVVYDPSAGFVTGGGWFTPDPQTCVCTPGSKATFGLVSQYKKGTSIPTGNQEFQYKVDNINLHSTSFDWLVVSGPQAQFQGTGTINGAGAYKFRVTVRDGNLIGQPDRFEIRILPANSNDFAGAPLWKGGNDLTGSMGAGSIVIHK